MTPGLDVDVAVPLVVDLDGTLVLTDTIYESLAGLLFHAPIAAGRTLFRLPDRAAFKRALAGSALPAIESLPLREDLVALIRAERSKGRVVHLVSAADQIVVDAVGKWLGLFERTVGSDGTTNLKGQAKLDVVRRLCPDGFLYAGDSAADLPLFESARGVILCDVDRSIASAIATHGIPILTELARADGPLAAWAAALRVHQWSKNILIFVALFLGHVFTEPAKVLTAAAAFLLLSILASGTYLLNDLSDLAVDRQHPTKRLRPFASGALPIAAGFAAVPAMIIGALVGAALLSPRFALLLLAYLAATSAYSFGLKQLPLTDVAVIGALFTLRVAMGAAVLGMNQSPWLLSFALAFFLSLALAKRHVEVMHATRTQGSTVVGRGYRADDWPVTLSFGVGAGLFSVVIMLLYLANDATPSGFYHAMHWLYAAPVLTTLWLMRIWLLSHRTELHDDPVLFALRDPQSLFMGIALAVAFFLAI